MVAEAPQSRENSRLVVLDALRGLAALFVLWHHIMNLHHDELQAWRQFEPISFAFADFISQQNGRAVLLFFVLSGIAIRLAVREPLTARPALANYAQRRALRILPLYWFSLAWTLVLGLATGPLSSSYDGRTLIGNLAFLQVSASTSGVWFVPYGDNGPYWSLSYEVFYYALVPLLFLFLGRRILENRATIPWLAFASSLVSLTAIGLGRILPSPPQLFLTAWMVWMLGFLIADRYLRGRPQWIVLPIACLPIIAQLALSTTGGHSDTLARLVDGCVIAMVLALGFQWRRSTGHAATIPSGLLGKMVAIGGGSYGLYLLHYPLLLFLIARVRPHMSSWTYWPSLAVAMFLFAIYFCPWVERCFSKLRRAARKPDGGRAIVGD